MILQEDGWVVCRVFKKKNNQRGIPLEAILDEEEEQHHNHLRASIPNTLEHKHNYFQMPTCDFSFDNSMHLPQLLSADASAPAFVPSSLNLNAIDLECSQNLMKLTSAAGGGGNGGSGGSGSGGISFLPQAGGDWSILEKLLASHQNLDQLFHNKCNPATSQVVDMGSGAQRFPFQYLGCDAQDKGYNL